MLYLAVAELIVLLLYIVGWFHLMYNNALYFDSMLIIGF